MSGTIVELMETIEDLMEDNDNQVANEMADDAIQLQTKYWEFKRNGGFSNLQKEYPNHSRFYEKLFAMFGGKTMYNLISQYSASDVRARVIKSHMNTCAARNSRIAAKLEKAGVNNITEMKSVYSHSGFNGTYTCDSNTGPKIITIETIVAGGPVQRLHNRVLVNVR
jgi:N-methylhydantoinase A/oxoprolinase/acetone carboxylase beta subunit